MSGGGLSETMGMGAVLPRVTIQFCTQCRWMLRLVHLFFQPFLHLGGFLVVVLGCGLECRLGYLG
jgi:hypothetical protein